MAHLTLPVGPRDHIHGNKQAPLTLVEYADYQCPFSGMAYYGIKKIQYRFGNNLRLVFRNFPLRQIHPRADAAASVAEAASVQGKFWEMHDILFENQETLDERSILQFAQLLNLDIPRFQRDRQLPEVADRIEEDFMSGIYSGVNGTPTFFINGQPYTGSYAYEELVVALEETLVPAS